MQDKIGRLHRVPILRLGVLGIKVCWWVVGNGDLAIGDHDRLKQYVIQHPVSEKQNLFRYSFKSNFLKNTLQEVSPLKKFHLHILYLNCTCSSIIYWIFFCGGKLDLQQYVRQLWTVSGGNWSSHSNTYTCTGGGNNRTITIHILTYYTAGTTLWFYGLCEHNTKYLVL